MNQLHDLLERYKQVIVDNSDKVATPRDTLASERATDPEDLRLAGMFDQILGDCIQAGRTISDPNERDELQKLADLLAIQIHYYRRVPPANRRIEEFQKPSAPQQRSNFDTTRLPNTGKVFVGRTEELAAIDRYWADGRVNVSCVIGSGGTGKTSLVKEWLERLSSRNSTPNGMGKVFAWHFRRAEEADFFEEAVRFFGVDTENLTPDDKWRALADAITRERNLLVLDQFESFQDAAPNLGHILSPAMETFLKRLAGQNAGLCVLTTRYPIPNLAFAQRTTAPVIALEPLTDDVGAELLRRLGVKGSDEELQQAVRDFSGHPLALTLLGNFLRVAHTGDILRRDHIRLLDKLAPQGSDAFRVCRSYEAWYEERESGRVDLAVLRLLGLFIGPLTLDQLRHLAEPPVVAGLNDALDPAGAVEVDRALDRLQTAGLLVQRRGTQANWPPFNDELDAHPLVREYFVAKLRDQHPDAWRQGHERLFEYLAGKSPKRPDTLREMRPVYHAIAHANRGGRHREALDLYQTRLQRGDEWFSARNVAAFSYELSALGSFFTDDFDTLAHKFKGSETFVICVGAARALRAQKRLDKAAELYDKASRITSKFGQWVSVLSNWCEVAWMSGDLDEAAVLAERLAGRSRTNRSTEGKKAGAVHLATISRMRGNFDTTRQQFAQARQFADGALSGMDAYWECEAELDKAIELALGEVLPPPPEPSPKSIRRVRPAPLVVATSPRRQEAQALIAAVREKARTAKAAALATPRKLEPILLDLVSGRASLVEAMHCAAATECERLLDEAWPLVEEAVFSLHESQQHQGWALLALATIRRLQGELKDAGETLAEAEEVVQTGGVRCHLPDVYLEGARLALACDDHTGAVNQFAKAQAVIKSMPGYGRLRSELHAVQVSISAASSANPR